MRRLPAVVFFASLLGAQQGQQPRVTLSLQQMVRDVWTTDQGLPQNAVNTLLQSRDGYIWVGTQEGVARFDGVKFTILDKRTAPAFNNNDVWALLEDHSGVLWIGTTGGLFRYRDGTIMPFDTAHPLHSVPVRALYEDPFTGSVWVGSNAGLTCLRNGVPVPFACEKALANNIVRAIIPYGNGLWIATDGNGLNYCVPDSAAPLKTFTVDNGLASNSVLSAARSHDGTLWIGTNGNYLDRIDGDRVEHLSPAEGFPGRIVYTVFCDADGTMWFGSGDGLIRLSATGKNRFTIFTETNGLTRTTVYSLLRDREGSLWVGTFSGGLNRFVQGSFLTHDVTDGLSANFAYCVLQDRSGTIWVGTDGGGLDQFLPGRLKNFSTKNGLAGNGVFSLFEDSKGTLWIGTFGNGLSRYAQGRFTTVSTRDGLCNNFVRAIAEDLDGRIWIGTRDGLSRYDHGRFTTFTTSNGLGNNYIRTLLVTPDGTVWVGTFGGGISRYSHGAFTTLTTRDGLTSNDIRSMWYDPTGAVWIGTDGGGLNRWKNGGASAVSIRNGLYDDVILSIVDDRQGNLWMTCNKGVFRASLRTLNEVADGNAPSVRCVSYGKADGIKNPECNAGQPSGVVTRSGRLWFPTAQGVISVDPREASTQRSLPPVIIERLLVDTDEEYPPHPTSLAPGRDLLEFQYTAVGFLASEKLRFRYRLEPFDKSWVDAGTRRSAFYTRLAPGAYTFRVAASYGDGVWSNAPASVAITLEPFFYQTPLFFIASFIAMIGVASGGVYYRLRALERRTHDLHALVDERTRDLKEQTQIAQQANAVKSHLLGIAAHDLKSPLVSMKGFAHLMKEEVGAIPSAVQKADTLQRLSQSMLDLINELLDSETIETGHVRLQPRTVDASLVMFAAVEIVRVSAERKEQRLELDLAPTGSCWVVADQERFRDVAVNLLSNAVKFSEREKRIWISTRQTGSTVQCSVRDEGPGLSDEDQKKMFARFQRLTPRPTAGETSTGLGLSIAKHLIELQGGTIRVESRSGSGSTFTVELPLVLAPDGLHS